MATEHQLESVTNLSKRAVTDYDALLLKYNQLVDDYSQTKSDLERVQSVLQPMLDEYGEIQTKYHVEKSLRSAAETYATRVVKDNKKIKRQSAMLLQHMSMSAVPITEMPIVEEETTEEQDEDSHLEVLNRSISELKSEISQLKVDLRRANDDKEVLEEERNAAYADRDAYKHKYEEKLTEIQSHSTTFQQQQRELKSLKRVSGLAYTEFQSLQDKYELERTLRLRAETYASELQRKRDSVAEKRRSSQLETVEEVNENEEVKNIMVENERLQAELSEQEEAYKKQIEDLEEELKNSSNNEAVSNEREKLLAISEELERVNTDFQTLKQENEALSLKVKKLEKERDDNMRALIPPPPPPPPPPGPAAGILKSLTDIIKDSKVKKAAKVEKIVGKDAKNEAMSSAIQEMMDRIKKGKGPVLKPVDLKERPDDLQPSSEGAAMAEMHSILVTMKKRAVAPRHTSTNLPEESELAKKLNRRKNASERTDADESEAPPVAAARTPPVPQPRKSVSNPVTTSTKNDPTSPLEFQATLSKLKRIPDDEKTDEN